MINIVARRIAKRLLPPGVRTRLEHRLLQRRADALRETLSQLESIEDRVDYALRNTPLRSNQKRAEIVALLRELQTLNPSRLCEIGADRGGTLALFASVAAPDAEILSIDIRYPSSRAAVYQTLARPGQKVTCLESDSHSPVTANRVRKWLNGGLLDFLFIDGDHSLLGVSADFTMYSELVRPGGVIAFHDIVPDYFSRYGRRTGSDVGEVPKFWEGLKIGKANWKEFIEDPGQDGYGIGVIQKSA